jgi:hypothetical protein
MYMTYHVVSDAVWTVVSGREYSVFLLIGPQDSCSLLFNRQDNR